MATPDFIPQNDSNFVPIRYYTAQDPYFYTVDNRPLQDIESNLKSARSGGADAARRATFLGSVNLAMVLADLYSIPSDSTAARVMTGLAATIPSQNTVTIGPGAVYETRQTSTSITDNIVKMAMMTKSATFTLTAPVSAGTSIVYTIEGTFVELTSASLTVSQLPNVDATNTYLPSTLTHGELQLSLNSGVAAATGSAVPPATTTGKFPLYNVTVTQGATNPLITAHANSPYMKGLRAIVTPTSLTTASATLGVNYDMRSVSFADGATTGIALPFVGSSSINPYRPIKVRITFSSSAAGGNVVFRLRYACFASGDSVALAQVSTNNEIIPVTQAANTMQTYTFSIALVPSSAFASNSSGVWTVVKDKFNIVMDRLGADASDNNTGTVTVYDFTLIQ